VKQRSTRGSHGTGRLCLVAVVMAVLSASPYAAAGSPAAGSRRRRTGREPAVCPGKYEDAEKAYVEAQVKSPGKPEVLYNLGNALIKQKKYDQGLQSLRQSMDKATRI